MARSEILNTNEAMEANYRQVVAEFKEDVYPAFRDEGVPLADAMMFYELVCVENRLINIEKLLEEKYA